MSAGRDPGVVFLPGLPRKERGMRWHSRHKMARVGGVIVGGVIPPFQGWAEKIQLTTTQGDAPGWINAAPLALNSGA